MMCGRYTFAADATEVAERFKITNIIFPLQPRYNIAPTQEVAAVVREGENNYVVPLRWGLIPSWARELSFGARTFNARAETMATKASFKESFRFQRCLVLANGFFEWVKGPVKIPYLFTISGGGIFAFAGLWASWTSPEGRIIKSCTIITTTANKIVSPLHDRMPVILPRQAEDQWLDHRIYDLQVLQALLQPYPDDYLQVAQVSTIVNSPQNDLPECIRPVKI